MKLVFASAFAVSAALAVATPSVFSYSAVGATNLQLTNYIHNLDIDYSNTGGYTQVSIARSFTGNDAAGNERTMTFQASSSAFADYIRLRTRVEGKVLNTYYNPSNAPYFYNGPDENENGQVDPEELILNEDGSPDSFSAAGTVGTTDDLAFTGNFGLGYTAQYIFFIHGQMSGDFVFPTLGFQIAGYTEESYTLPATTGPIGQYYATKKYAISPQANLTVDVSFTTQFNPSVYFYPDGSTIEGEGLFDSTITVAGIRVFDPSGNQVFDVTAQGSSGTVYSTNPVPEPASFAALGLGALALIRRRRRV